MIFKIPPMTDYFQLLDENLVQAQSEISMLYPLIEEIDRFYRHEVFVDVEGGNSFAAQLCLNAHLLLLAMARQALSGHPASVFPLGRTALESACYAFLIRVDDRLGDVWLNRHESEQHQKECRKEFGQAVSETAKILNRDVDELGSMVTELYQQLIDFGAHPNSKSVVEYLHLRAENDQGLVPTILGGVYAIDDPLTLRAGLAYIETALITALIICGALGENHPLLQADSTRFVEFFARKGELFDRINDPSTTL